MSYDEHCIFCKIIKGEIPSVKVAENEHCIAINDIAPKAPVHILVIPKQHVKDIMEASDEIIVTAHKMIKDIARELGLDEKGFRIINNCGSDAGQTVWHVHFHILSGRMLGFE